MKKFTNLLALLLLTIVFFVFFNSCDIIGDTPTPETNVGDTLWVHEKPVLENTTWIRDMPMAIGKDSSIYYLADGANNTFEPLRVYAINKDDGSLKWKTDKLASSHPGSNIVVGDDGTVYIISNTKLYSIDSNTGSINWEWEVPETINFEGNIVGSYGSAGGLALANNGDLILKTIGSGSYYRAMYCVSPQGNTRWYRVIGAVGTNITIGITGYIFDYAYWGNNKYLYKINQYDGSVIWKTPMLYHGAANNNIVITHNGGVICSMSDSLGLLNPVTGEYIWKVLAQTNYKVKLMGNDGYVSVYDQWTGRHYYYIADGIEGKIIPSGAADPMVFGNSGNYYRGDLQGMVCYNLYGEELWNFNSEGTKGWSLTISYDNIIYLVSGEKVFAIQGDSSLSKSGWPCTTHDNRNTFNYSKY